MTYTDPWMNYNSYALNDYEFRGPRPQSDKFISCLGAAQTFGRFCYNPFPTLIRHFLKIETYNFGYPGAGPRFLGFTSTDQLDIINKSQVCIVQVMSGRSVGNSRFKCLGKNWGTNLDTGEEGVSQKFWEFCIENYSEETLKQLMLETEEEYILAYEQLANKISVPTILLFMRRFDNTGSKGVSNISQLLGDFPHIVTSDTIKRVSVFFDHFVDSVCDEGLPQRYAFPVKNRYHSTHLGQEEKVLTHNNYYPSQDMHFDAFDKLKPCVVDIIKESKS